MKRKLMIAVKNPFVERDVERFNTLELQKHFELIVLDCSSWLLPVTAKSRQQSENRPQYVVNISSYSDLQKKVTNIEGSYLIDFIGLFSTAALRFFDYIKRNNCKVIVIDSGPYPSPGPTKSSQTLVKKLAVILRNGLIQRFLYARWLRLYSLKLAEMTPDIALVSGTSWKQNPRFYNSKKIVGCHSFDYETFLGFGEASSHSDARPYAVYLDENIAAHEDNEEMNLANPVSGTAFLETLENFFAEFESVSGIEVKIAAYPSTDAALYRKYFKTRDIRYYETSSLIAGSVAVFAHASTAISFAVLWRKPLFFLVNSELKNSWYFADIESAASILSREIVDLRHPLAKAAIEEMLNIDESSYRHYEETYIKSAGSPAESIWRILQNEISSEQNKD